MKKYRIGRIAEPWVNFEPPIRGGIFRGYTDVVESDSDDIDETSDEWSSSLESSNSSTTSLDNMIDTCLKKIAPTSTGPGHSMVHTSSSKTSSIEGISNRSRSLSVQTGHHTLPSPHNYTMTAEQQEIDEGIQDNPSLDAKTQREITKRYQALHQQIKDEGFYDCRYTEYGKETIRYVLLFAAFIICLRVGWYMTSACFLGLFWV